MGKSKKQSHKPKSKDTNQEKLYLLHMDLYGTMRVASVNGKKYILVIVDDYSRFTWVNFLASKDEAPDFIIKFLKMIQVRLNATVRNIRTDNGTEFVNQTLRDYYEQLTAMASKQLGSGPGLQSMTPATSSSRLIANPIPQQPCNPPPRDDWDRLFQSMFDEYFNPPTIAVSPVLVANAPRVVDLADSPVSTSINQDAPSTSILSTQDQKHSLIISQGFEESLKTPHFHDDPLHESLYEDSTTHHCTQSNGFAGIKASDNAGQAKKETEPDKDYILLPLWTADLLYFQDPKSSHDNVSKPSSDDGKKVDENPRKDSECKDQEKEDNVNSTNNVNTVNYYSIFDFPRDNEDDGAVADMNNLDTTIQVCPNPTTRIHKDHPIDQTQQPRKPKRKDTQVPQSSDPIENVVDKAVHKELGDSLVRAATTASSLEAEQDSAEFDKEERLAREKAEKEKEANIALIKTWDDIQENIDVIINWLKDCKHENKKSSKRAERKGNKTTKQQVTKKLKKLEGFMLNGILKLKEFDSIQEMFDRSFKRVNTFKDFRTELVKGKEKRAGTELIQEITKKQKVEDDKETSEFKQLIKTIPDEEEEVAIDVIHLVVKSPSIVDWNIYKEGRKSYYQIMRADEKSQMYMIFSQMLKSFNREDLEDLYKLIYMLVEKKYPFAPLTLSMMLEKKLMIDYETALSKKVNEESGEIRWWKRIRRRPQTAYTDDMTPSYLVLLHFSRHGPSDAMHNPPQPLKITKIIQKHIASNFAKLDKFEGVDIRRWQNALLALQHECGNVESSKELWDFLESKYMAKDASNFKHTLKHKKEELTLVELGSHLRIKEFLRVADKYNDNKSKRKHHDNTRVDPNKKAKPTCWKCGKTSHIKRDCKGVNVGNMSNSSGTKSSVDGFSNLLKGHNMFNKSLQVYYVTYVYEAYFVQDDDVTWWVDSGATIHVCKDRWWFKTYESLNDGSILHRGNESTTLVYGRGCVDLRLNIVNDNTASAFMSTSKLNDSILWHARPGHVHFKRMQDMSKDGLIPAFDMNTEKSKTCILTKITKKPFQNVKRETKVLELIHSDLCDLYASPSLGNKKYFVTFIDDPSRTDRGGEYMDTLLFQSVGIIHETTAPYTLQQNGISERKNRVLKEMVNSMLSYSGLSQRVWGCKEVVRLHDPKLKTLGERGIGCIIVGYAEHSKAFRFFVIEPDESVSINSTIKSRGAIFDDNRFSSVPRQSLSIPKGTEDIGGSVVPELKRSLKRDEVSDQHSYCFNVADDPKTFDEAMKSQDGFRKKLGIDYFDTYALVARISTIRLLIAMASIHNIIIHQMDVKTAFLNDELDGEVYMNQPQGFIMPGNENKLCKLIKSLYGLNKSDETGKGVIIYLYVDDMLIFSTNQDQVDLTKEFSSSRFSMKDMGEADVILGIRIKHESNRITISQSRYIKKVLKKFNYFDCTPVSTLMDTSEKLMPNIGQVVSQLKYSRVIGYLMYAMTCTRPDIAFAVGKLSSWISNTKDNSSTSGWVFLLGGGAISWASKKQTCITGSTMEYEFVALAAAGKEVEWLKNFLLEILLWSKPIAPISIRCDSPATLLSSMWKDERSVYSSTCIYISIPRMCLELAEKEGEVFTSEWYSNGLKGSILRTP
ncbi:zinc finger, CCHC-type containing protein [Tanacetum coccineum]